MRKIIFLESGENNPNNIKRMEEFKDRGYNVLAYAFSRNKDNMNFPKGVEVHNIGCFASESSYFSRIGVIWKGIKSVIDKHKDDDCVFYLLKNDMAIVYSYLSTRPYIFEEADMTHLSVGRKWLGNYMEKRVKRIIKHSVISVFRSEGFLKYHFGKVYPDNVYVIPNRLHPDVLNLPEIEHNVVDDNCIKYGFVGGIRYNTIFSFANFLLKNFPQHQFHFFGNFSTKTQEEQFSVLKKYTNCYFHGPFKSPDDLPAIYSQIDVVLSAYDVRGINPRYAEPNKLYESIYFDKPIIVSSNSFLAEKVDRLGIGYDVDALNEADVIDLVDSINEMSIEERKLNINRIDKHDCINSNEAFFTLLEKRLSDMDKKSNKLIINKIIHGGGDKSLNKAFDVEPICRCAA